VFQGRFGDDSPGALERLRGFPIRLSLASLYPRSNIYRTLITNPGAAICLDEDRVYSRNLEVPSGGGDVRCQYYSIRCDSESMLAPIPPHVSGQALGGSPY
jgi:hypothetical protein